MHYYFAYGSNMDLAQMKERCPGSKLIGQAVLKDYDLGFTIHSTKRNCGCADVLRSAGKKVYGLLYSLTDADLKELDCFEGHPSYYKRFSVEVIEESGNPVRAETYEVVNKKAELQKPSKDYLGKLIVAAKEFNFPAVYQEYLASIKTVD